MLHFDSDYMEGAHPTVMQRLVETNLEQTVGYGEDEYTRRAADLIREACGCPDALVRFLVGGTQANATVIDAVLRSYQGVIAAESGHISVHEAGAIEFGGHKVITLKHRDGKLSAETIEGFMHSYEQDETRHQTGIIVTLEFDNGSVYYTFRYSNPVSIEKSSNNLLADARCRLGEVYPKINDSDRNYRLYIPSDLTEINLSVAAQDTGATYDLPKSLKVSPDQEPTIMLDVFASNGEKRTYSFEVKRLNKNCSQVEKEMASPDFESLVKGEFFYQKPAFKIGITCAIAGILLIFVFIKIAKRLTIKVEDNDELNFFD